MAKEKSTERRITFCIVFTVVISVLVIVAAGVCVFMLLPSDVARVVLIILIIALVIIGVSSFTFLEYQRKQALKKRDAGAEQWVHRTFLEQKFRGNKPSAPPRSERSSWALAPWRWSQRTTLPAYSSRIQSQQHQQAQQQIQVQELNGNV